MTKTPLFILLLINKYINVLITIWVGVKVIHKRALLKDKIALLCFRLPNHYTTMFPFDLTRIVYMHLPGVFQNHIPQRWKVYNLCIFMIQGFIFHFTLCCTFSVRGSKYRVNIVLWTTRYKFFNKVARAVLLQLICVVTHIIPCFEFSGVFMFLNKDDRFCMSMQNRLPQITQILVRF